MVEKALPWAFSTTEAENAVSRFLHVQWLAAIEHGGTSLCRAQAVEKQHFSTACYVESGRLRVTARVELEDRCRLRPGLQDLGPGETFGELSLFGGGKRSATVTALEPVRLIEIDGPALERHLEAHPELGYAFLRALLRSLATRLARTDHQMEHLFAWGLRAHGLERHL